LISSSVIGRKGSDFVSMLEDIGQVRPHSGEGGAKERTLRYCRFDRHYTTFGPA
jgi:hypothetical protein